MQAASGLLYCFRRTGFAFQRVKVCFYAYKGVENNRAFVRGSSCFPVSLALHVSVISSCAFYVLLRINKNRSRRLQKAFSCAPLVYAGSGCRFAPWRGSSVYCLDSGVIALRSLNFLPGGISDPSGGGKLLLFCAFVKFSCGILRPASVLAVYLPAAAFFSGMCFPSTKLTF